MRDRLLSRLFRLMDSPAGAALGALVYGAWAYFVNRHAGMAHASLIGATHWMMSVAITMACVGLMRGLFGLARRPWVGALLSVSGSLGATYSVLIGVHLWIGTPHILLTLAPGLLPTIGFATIYTSLLLRERSRPPVTAAPAGGLPSEAVHARA